MTYLKRFMSWF